MWRKIVRKIAIAFITAAALVLASCASAPPSGPKSTVMTVAYPPKIIEHQNSAFGGTVPAWVTMDQSELQAQPQYKDVYVFKIETVGKNDLDAANLFGTHMDAMVPLAQQISTRVQEKFAGSQVGDKSKVETYMEQVVKSLSDATFSGFKKEGQFWVHLQTYTVDGKPDKQEYRIRYLYTIPKDTLDKEIAQAMDAVDAANKPKSDDEKTARALVKQSIESGL
jgi:hypothetical protein